MTVAFVLKDFIFVRQQNCYSHFARLKILDTFVDV